jgi:hypothetical protein
MAEKKKYNSILVSGRKDQTLTYSKYVKDEESGESVKESLDKKVNVTDELTTQQIKDGAITNEKMAADSVGNTNLQDGSVSNEKLEDGSITNEKLAENSITKDKLQDKTIGVEKLDNELRQAIAAATGLPENLVETIQNVDDTLKNHQRQLDDKQSQIDDKQQQITANDEDISLLQTRSTQMEETIKGIAATGGASQATAVTYDNAKSGLDAVNIQSAIDEIINNLGHYETNEEWLRAYTDTEGKFLWGIRVDGSIDWSVGIPTPIRKKLQEIVTKCQQDKTDLTEAIATAKEELNSSLQTYQQTTDASITKLQEGKVDKEKGKSLIEDEVKECFMVIENEEFIYAVIDSEDRLLFGIYRATGKPYYPQNDMYHISQSEEFLWIIIDAANHPLLGIKQDGTCWAAKAQWLDDIKAIKEALSSIDKTLKTFQPKEDGKGLITLDVADSFFYISNDEYIIAVVDAENRILAGIKYDGDPYFPNHEMYSVVTNEEWLYAIIDAEDKILGGFRADDGHMIVGSIDISTFISDAIIDISDIKERTSHLSTIDNDEYLSVETDSDGKVIGYTAPDGSHYIYKVKSETIPEEFSHIEDPEGRTEITTDAEGKVMSFRDSQGKKHEHDMEVTKLDVSNLNLQGNSVNDIEEALKRNGFSLKSPMDWSEQNELQIPEPYCAYADIVGELPTTKGNTTKGIISFYDMQGNYFKKYVEIDIHGRTSADFKKKNYTLDFYNDQDYSDSFNLRFGDWVSMDSYYFQGWYSDAFRGIDIIGYKLYQQFINTYGFTKDKPYKVVNYSNATYKSNDKNAEINYNFCTNALCTPMGFPVILSHNGKFIGIYTVMLKKNRKNFQMDKSNYKEVLLDMDSGKLIEGQLDWTSFEIRNPKTLICMDGTKYDGDNPKELIDESSDIYVLSNKDMNNSITTKNAIKGLCNAYLEIKKAIEDKKSNEEIRNIILAHFNVDYVLDYFLFSNLIDNQDGWGGNCQWATWDSTIWFPMPYDLNATFGMNPYGTDAGSPNHSFIGNELCKNIRTYFNTEFKNRYKELRDKKIIDKENIIKIFFEWIARIGTDNYKKEFKLWDTSPSYRSSCLNSEYWEKTGWFQSISLYNNAVSYSIDQLVQYNENGIVKIFKSLVDENTGNSLDDDTKWQDVTYTEGKQYNIGDIACFYKDNFIRVKCIKSCINEPPVTKVYDEPYGLWGYFDGVSRIYKWIEDKIEVYDSFLDYNN